MRYSISMSELDDRGILLNCPKCGRRFRVNAIPTMVLFENGMEVARQAGAMPAPRIRKFVEQHP